ncbi:MAG: PQQ-binding-like beta-propeller repeat protein [Candidatus Brocadiia bacterium]
MNTPLRKTLCLVFLASLLPSVRAENWPQWRGPFLNGSTTETGLPATFSATENVVWATDLPGPSGSTPIVWGDRVFVSSLDVRTKDLVGLCLDARTGEVLWRFKAGENERRFRDNDGSSPSPVTDGQTVWFYYGTSDLLAFDFDGKLLWRRKLEQTHGHNALMFGYSSSPLLYEGKLYIIALRNKRPNRYRSSTETQPTPSYLLAIDPRTGKDLWRQDRPTDARDEAQEAYSTAIPLERDGRSEILVFGADYLTAHDPDTGRETWRWATYNPTHIHHWRIIPSPVVGAGLVYVVGPKYSTMFAIRPGRQGTVRRDHVAWTFDDHIPDASTPLFYRGRLYVVEDNKKILTCLDPESGRPLWQGRIGGRAVIRASLTGADGKLYVINERGEAFVLAAGDEFRLLHTAAMGGRRVRSTIAAAQSKLFVRTSEKLFCIQK